MKCKNCGELLPDESQFCNHCGVKIQKMDFCTECGAQISSSSKFCQPSGHNIPAGNIAETNNEIHQNKKTFNHKTITETAEKITTGLKANLKKPRF